MTKRGPTPRRAAASGVIAGSVVLAYCHPGRVEAAFHESVLNLTVFDSVNHRRLLDGGGRIGYRSGVNVAGTRNEMVRKFLGETQAEWLWMVDTDMEFAPDTLERLLEHADPENAPIVGGLCFGIDMGLLFPTMYELSGTKADPQFLRYQVWPPNAMFQVFATGGACLLMHRSALVAIRDYQQANGQVGFSPAFPWFQEREFGQRPMSEDITFCMRAGVVGLPVFVNTGVQLGHVKDQLLTFDGYKAQRAMLDAREQGDQT
jgi:hypothetical protein